MNGATTSFSGTPTITFYYYQNFSWAHPPQITPHSTGSELPCASFHFVTCLQYKATNSTVFNLSNISWAKICILFDLLFSSLSNNKAIQAKSLNESCLNISNQTGPSKTISAQKQVV